MNWLLVINHELKSYGRWGVKPHSIEYNILLLLMKNKGKYFPLTQIYEEIWNEVNNCATITVRCHIRHIRKNQINPQWRDPQVVVFWVIKFEVGAQPYLKNFQRQAPHHCITCF